MKLDVQQKNVYTVSRLNQEVRRLVIEHFALIRLQGEISDFVRAASGHLYFSLKDEQSRVRCVMFRSQNRYLDCRPENGLQVMVSARVEFYTVRGEFQLVVQSLKLEKQGELQRQFEALKNKLQAEGLFSEERKKPLPAMPSRIGIVSSLKGAALQDVLSSLRTRWRLAAAIIFPSAVQGEGAAEELCRMIKTADRSYGLDVLILVRGGGSLEDLSAFNDEGLARTIAACRTPVVTGIGHEIDFTIADLVADCRAPTPTAAVSRSTPEQAEVREKLSAASKRLHQLIGHKMEREKQGLRVHGYRLASLHPLARVESMMQFCDEAGRRLQQGMLALLAKKRQSLRQAGSRLISSRPTAKITRLHHELRLLNKNLFFLVGCKLKRQRDRLARLQTKHKTLNPHATLKRGYAIVSRQDGAVVDTVRKVQRGERLNVRVCDGAIGAVAQEIRKPLSSLLPALSKSGKQE